MPIYQVNKLWKRHRSLLFGPHEGPVRREAIIKPASTQWPTGVPRADHWWDANTLVEAGVADGADVGHNANGTEWFDRESNTELQVSTDSFLPDLDATTTGFGDGNEPTVHNIGATPNFELLQPLNPVEIDWPTSGDGADPCSMAFMGRIDSHGSILGDNNTSINPAHKFGLLDAGGGNSNWEIGGASATLGLGDFTTPTFPFNFIVVISKTSSSNWNCWSNGVQVGSGLGTFGVAMVWQRMMRARPTSAGWPHCTWRCRHQMFWNDVALSAGQVTAFNSFFNSRLGVY